MKKASSSPTSTPPADLFELDAKTVSREIVAYFDTNGPGLSGEREQQAARAVEAILQRHRIESVTP